MVGPAVTFVIVMIIHDNAYGEETAGVICTTYCFIPIILLSFVSNLVFIPLLYTVVPLFIFYLFVGKRIKARYELRKRIKEK